jgi:hypothetical protein
LGIVAGDALCPDFPAWKTARRQIQDNARIIFDAFASTKTNKADFKAFRGLTWIAAG